LVLPSARTIGYKGEQCSGGEGVSQSPMKDKAFLTFLGQNPPVELRRKLAFSPQSFHGIHLAHPSTFPTLQRPSAVQSRIG
jgi:hypothetical protein